MDKLNVIELDKEYVDNGIVNLRYVCPSHTKDTVKVQGGDDWIAVEFHATDIMAPDRFSYSTNTPVNSINCSFKDGILTCKVTLEVPKQRKLNVTFD